MQRPVILATAAVIASTSACAREPATFSEQNARTHVQMLAGTIGSRPVGTPENARARAYIIDQLRLSGFDVRVQETDARRSEIGRTARVSNIIAVKRGTRDEAVGLLSHYDSAPEAPGAGDDGFGVAVSLEAARVLGSRADRNWSLMVLVTDGEEAGLMGAAALVTDREVMDRLSVYVNVEAAGSSGPAQLFETGPANAWVVRPWARHAPNPRGDSFGTEIYRRLPNDTDFSILKQRDVPGLNFAIIGDSYAYHTARDTPERLSAESLRVSGENIVATISALDRLDITQRTSQAATYFDIAGRAAVTYGPLVDWALAALALGSAVVAWVRVSSAAIALGGAVRWLLTLIWTMLGAALVILAMIGTTVALRSAREVYHPWYAYPDRFFLLLIAVGVTVGWATMRLGRFLPARAHGLRHPLVTWSATLPVWILLAAMALWTAPGAAYLWTVPLLTAGLLLSVARPKSAVLVRIVSLIVFAVAAIFWLLDTRDLLRFMVAVFGRLPIITPPFAYAAILTGAGLMLVPPFVAAVATTRPLLRPSIMTALLLLAVAGTAGWAYVAPAYTYDQPLRRHVRAIQPARAEAAVWEVASIEPGLDLAEHAPPGWTLARGPTPDVIPWSPLPHPFVFRNASGPALGLPPMSITEYSARPLQEGVDMQLTLMPKEPGLGVTILLPGGITPARSNLPGVPRRGRWSAAFVAVPEQGLTFRASFTGVAPDVLQGTEVIVWAERFPVGSGWQKLPEWLPQQQTVWSATAAWQLRLSEWAGIAPVPPLR